MFVYVVVLFVAVFFCWCCCCSFCRGLKLYKNVKNSKCSSNTYSEPTRVIISLNAIYISACKAFQEP